MNIGDYVRVKIGAKCYGGGKNSVDYAELFKKCLRRFYVKTCEAIMLVNWP